MFPLYALIVTLFVFLFFANWGLRIGMNCESLLWYGFIYIICPFLLSCDFKSYYNKNGFINLKTIQA